MSHLRERRRTYCLPETTGWRRKPLQTLSARPIEYRLPGTIDAMLPFIDKETGIHFAAAYVLFSDPDAVLTQGLTSAVVVGSDTGARCAL